MTCAQALLTADWQAVMVGRREDALQKSIDSTSEKAAIAIALPADLSCEDAVQALFQALEQRFGRLDLLLSNAGVSLPYTLPGDLSGADCRRMVNINLNGAFYCLSQAFKLMQKRSSQGGRIINNDSISAHVPCPGSIAHAATKHAVSGLTRAAALDGRAFNIAVG